MKILTFFFLLITSLVEGTPSSVFWTYCTTDVYATGTGHIDVDNTFSVFNRRGQGTLLSPDTGFEVGIFSCGPLRAEAGIDYLGGTDDPVFFNIGIGAEEDTLFCGSPSYKIGFFNVGTRHRSSGKTNENVIDFILGKKLLGGHLFVGGFAGSRTLGKNRQGFMLAYQRFFCPAEYCCEYYHKWLFVADYASGKNTIGGGGFGLGYYFTPDIRILTGPVWFNSATINGKWKWSVQIDMSFGIW